MGFREVLEKKPFATKMVAILFISLCAVIIWRELRSQGVPASVLKTQGKEFYSDDDGKTWFLDDQLKGSPIDHNGKPAYRALVYRCPDGKPFVAYLAKYSDEQQAQIARDAAKHPGPSQAQLGPLRSIRKPGETKWAANSSPSITGYPSVPCPDGAGTASPVSPADPDSALPIKQNILPKHTL